MANKRTRAVSEEEFFLLIDAINKGFITKDGKRVHRNPQISMILTLQGNLGLRISDCINLRLSDIVKEAGRYRLNIIEKKTGKKREFTIPENVYNYILRYMLEMGIKPTQKLFSIGIRAVQKHLKITADHLGLEGIGTHSLRKFFCTQIYNNNHFNIELCRVLMQHSSSFVTSLHWVTPQLFEQALQNHVKLPN